jgi:hypothetical protein
MRKSAPRIFVDSFTVGLDEMKCKEQADKVAVLRVLHKTGRFSVFEATANSVIAKTIDELCKGPYLTVDTSMGYPWTKVTLTEAGKKLAGIEQETTDGQPVR